MFAGICKLKFETIIGLIYQKTIIYSTITYAIQTQKLYLCNANVLILGSANFMNFTNFSYAVSNSLMWIKKYNHHTIQLCQRLYTFVYLKNFGKSHYI